MNIRPLGWAISIATLTLANACSATSVRDERLNFDANTPVKRAVAAHAEFGRVQNIGDAPAAARTSGAGGGLVPSSAAALATGAGVIGGAIAGHAIQGRNRRDDGVYRVSVGFDNGSVRDFDFARIHESHEGDSATLEGRPLQRL